MKFRLVLLAFSMMAAPSAVMANYCPSPASRSNVTISGVVNTYYPITSDIIANGQITIGNPRGAAEDLKVGDLILLWVHQFAQLKSDTTTNAYGSNTTTGKGWTFLNHTGKFEWLRVAGQGGSTSPNGTVVRSAGTTGNVSITVTNGAGNAGFPLLDFTVDSVRSAQVIRVPQYGNATISGTLTAVPYRQTATSGVNGPQGTGGIVVIDTAGALTFSAGGKIDVDGLGFRGGAAQRFDGRQASGAAETTLASWYSYSPFQSPANQFGGIKGEGFAGTPRRVVDQGTLTDGLDYSASTVVPVDGYGACGSSSCVPSAWGRGAPGNAGGGATDQCPYGQGNEIGRAHV